MTFCGVQVHFFTGLPKFPQGAGIHRRDQHYAAGVAHRAAGAGDHDVAVFKRLTERFQHAAVELRKLVQEQHSVGAPV